MNDEAFAGIGALRVLYISGDLLNVQYVSQTNVLGDSDQVALAMNQFVAHPEAEWTVTTGGNQVANFAGIVDVDGTDKTYVGGEHYSHEILIQADIISSDPELGGQNPDALVNEAVAFLAPMTPPTTHRRRNIKSRRRRTTSRPTACNQYWVELGSGGIS